MRKSKFFRTLILGLVLCLAFQGACPAYAATASSSSALFVQSEYGLSDEAMAFLQDHNVDLSVFKSADTSMYNADSDVVSFSMNESILGLIQETEAYNFTDEQIQQYVDGLVNCNPIVVAADDVQPYASTPSSTRNSDGPGFEVKSKSGYYQSTAFLTLPTAYNAGGSNSWMFYTVSSPTSNWGIDVGIFYAYGYGGNAWRGCYTEQGNVTVSGSVISELTAGSRVYFNATIESSGYLLFRILDATNFSKEYYSLYYYVGGHNIYRSNGVFNRQITMTSNTGVLTNGSYIENAIFSDAYVYSSDGYSRTTASNTEPSRRGVLSGTGVSASLTTVNSYTPWYSENISILFS